MQYKFNMQYLFKLRDCKRISSRQKSAGCGRLGGLPKLRSYWIKGKRERGQVGGLTHHFTRTFKS